MEPKSLIKYLFLVQAIIACFTCYARPDYNLPLFLFAYILWDAKEKLTDNYVHKFRLTIMFIISLIVDLVWIIYWGCFWGEDAFDNAWNSGLHTFVLLMSIINFVIKLIMTFMIIFFDPYVRKSLSSSGIKRNMADIKHIFSQNQQQQLIINQQQQQPYYQ